MSTMQTAMKMALMRTIACRFLSKPPASCGRMLLWRD
jgi:hypothetical protein